MSRPEPGRLVEFQSWAPPPPIVPQFVEVTPPVRRRRRLRDIAALWVFAGVVLGVVMTGTVVVLWRGVRP